MSDPIQPDLFGNLPPEKTFEDEYREYLSSSKWRQKREQALHRAGYKCERCGNQQIESPLEVHHKTYENFKHEPPEDLEVVCKVCHELADREREARIARERRRRQAAALYQAQLEGWGEKVYGEYWYLNDDIEFEFDQWLEERSW